MKMHIEIFRINDDNSTESIQTVDNLLQAIKVLKDDDELNADMWIDGKPSGIDISVIRATADLIAAIDCNIEEENVDENGNWFPIIPLQYINDEFSYFTED